MYIVDIVSKHASGFAAANGYIHEERAVLRIEHRDRSREDVIAARSGHQELQGCAKKHAISRAEK